MYACRVSFHVFELFLSAGFESALLALMSEVGTTGSTVAATCEL